MRFLVPFLLGPTLFSKTTDAGATWSPPTVIVQTGNKQQTIGNQIVVGPDGTLYNFLDLILGTGMNGIDKLHGLNVAYTKSTDGGSSWTAPEVIAKLNTVGVTDPNTGGERSDRGHHPRAGCRPGHWAALRRVAGLTVQRRALR